jgi:hypothetical protein
MLKPDRARSTVSKHFKFRRVNVKEEVPLYADSSLYRRHNNYHVDEARFDIADSRVLNPWAVTFNFQHITLPANGNSRPNLRYTRIFVDARYRISYNPSSHAIAAKGNQKKHGLDMRLFAGKFFEDKSAPIDPEKYRYGFNFHTRGQNDYMYDHIVLARRETTTRLRQQIIEQDGFFKQQTIHTASVNWMLAFNLVSTIPITNLPIQVYFDGGISSASISDAKGSTEIKSFVYDYGIRLNLVKDIMAVYFPIHISTLKLQNSDKEYINHVRFVFSLEKLNPYRYAKTFSI